MSNICNACVWLFIRCYQSGQKKDEDKPPSDDKWNVLDMSSWKKASVLVTQTTLHWWEWMKSRLDRTQVEFTTGFPILMIVTWIGWMLE